MNLIDTILTLIRNADALEQTNYSNGEVNYKVYDTARNGRYQFQTFGNGRYTFFDLNSRIAVPLEFKKNDARAIMVELADLKVRQVENEQLRIIDTTKVVA